MRTIHKAVISILTALSFAGTLVSALPVSAQEHAVKPLGDFNGDFAVDETDATDILRLYAKSMMGLASNLVTAKTVQADCNTDGVLNELDATEILNYMGQVILEDTPRWLNERKVTYIDHRMKVLTEELVYDENGYPLLDENGNFVFTKPSGKPVRENFDADGLSIEIGCAEGRPGEEVTIPVTISADKGIAAAQISIPAQNDLELVKINSDFMYDDPNSVLINKAPSVGIFIWLAEKGTPLIFPGSKTFVSYTFRIPETAKPGDVFNLDLNPNQSDFVTTYSFDEKTGNICLNNDTIRYCYEVLNGAIIVK